VVFTTVVEHSSRDDPMARVSTMTVYTGTEEVLSLGTLWLAKRKHDLQAFVRRSRCASLAESPDDEGADCGSAEEVETFASLALTADSFDSSSVASAASL
jgi:hypothetical protein